MLAALLGVISISLAITPISYAESPPLTLSITPNAVSLSPGERAQTLVTATVATTTVQSITLSAFSDATVDVAISDPARTGSPLRGDVAWVVAIARSDTGRPTRKVLFRADYQVRDSDGQITPGVATAALDVQERIPGAIDQVVTATLDTAIETLQDQQTRQVFIVVENISSVPVTVTAIRTWPVPRIATSTEDLGTGFRLEPQQSNPFPIQLTAGDAVQSGKHLLVVRVDVEWDKAGLHTDGSLVLNKELSVGVFGESAILQATTIPSVMLLPGFLFVTALALLINWSGRKAPLDLDLLDFKKPGFWLVAITVSLIFILFYPFLTGPLISAILRRPMVARDYLQGYGFNDILMLWLGALLAALVAFVGGVALAWIWREGRGGIAAFRAWRERERRAPLVPTPDDSPLLALRKIANNQKGFDLKEVMYPKGTAPQYVFELPSGFPEPGKVWVAPRVRLRWRKDDDRLKDGFDVLNSKEHDTRTLVRTLERWLNPEDPIIELDWESGAEVSQPKLWRKTRPESFQTATRSSWRINRCGSPRSGATTHFTL